MALLNNFFVWLVCKNTVLSKYGTTDDAVYKNVLEKVRGLFPGDQRRYYWRGSDTTNEKKTTLKKAGFSIVRKTFLYDVRDPEILLRVGWRLYLSITISEGDKKRHAILYRYTGKKRSTSYGQSAWLKEMEYLHRGNRLFSLSSGT
jgi:hypothetical protein